MGIAIVLSVGVAAYNLWQKDAAIAKRNTFYQEQVTGHLQSEVTRLKLENAELMLWVLKLPFQKDCKS